MNTSAFGVQKSTKGSAAVEELVVGLPTKKSKVLLELYLSEIYKNQTIEVGAAKLFSVNLSWT